jgi:K+-transporting ATPase ATPase C chain
LTPDETPPQSISAPQERGLPRRSLAIALRLTAVLILLCGVAYPALIYEGAQFAFPANAEGSVVRDACGVAIGSRLIGQSFTRTSYFWGRPSAVGHDARNSGASNFGPLSPALRDSLVARASALRTSSSFPADAPLPPDAISASGSGLDPDISPAFAMIQVDRIARARSVSGEGAALAGSLRGLVAARTAGRQFAVLGEPRVNVLALNLALDSLDDRVHSRRRLCGAPTPPARTP